jgi:hypothetical protein
VCLVFAALSCSDEPEPLTELMVVVDSDMVGVDSVQVRVEGMGDPKVATASDLSKRPLPRTVAILHQGGPLGPIEVTAKALAASDAPLVSQSAKISFVRGRVITLTFRLEQSCVGVSCDEGDTCMAGSCEPVEIDASDLKEWTGKPPVHREAGAGGRAGGSGSGTGGGTSGKGGTSGTGSAGKAGSAGTRPAGQGGQGAGSGAMPPEAGSGGSPVVMKTCTGCAFDSATMSSAHGELTCEDGTCVLRCDAGYTDGDVKIANGCEKSASAFPWKLSNLDAAATALAAATSPALTIDCSATLDLGSGALANPLTVCSQQLQAVVVPQGAGAPDLVVFATRHLSVAAGSTFRFTGSRPVAFVVYGDADIDGKLDFSAVGANGAAGSNFECNPGVGGAGQKDGHAGGGGGGGFGTSGGNGGTSVPDDAPGGPSGPAASDLTLAPLRGGCAGGVGGEGDGAMAPGGAGGGALQISVAGKLRIAGTIAASGGGGAPGDDFGDGGGGGGSGGAILLEATTIETVAGAWVTVNGGGGGEGRVAFNNLHAGADGAHASTDAAAGGSGQSPGGNGAAGQTVAATAPACDASLCGGGGGGGGLGRIVMRARDCLLGGSASPPAACSAHLD